MAKLKSVINIEGTLNNLTFYKTQDGNLVKTKSGVSGNRIANDPAFARTRENGSEFGSAAKSGKLLRSALRNVMANASDNRVTSRLTQLMHEILLLDTTSERGSRNVATAIANAAAKAMLDNFNFNIHAALGTILSKPFTVDIATGIITINNFVPKKDLAFPVGATDVAFTSAWSKVNFAGEIYDTVLSNTTSLPINNSSGTVTLTPTSIPKGVGTNIFAMQIVFSQTVNAQTYPLSNGAFNCLCIVNVS